ncbi:MAG: DUF1080 domain-containing protein [Planctomycetes bacterium]|nr:DUF1080 domain-containing protein [Planctomycetota bacterium]
MLVNKEAARARNVLAPAALALFSLLAAPAGGAAPQEEAQALTPAEKAAGWTLLFDGESPECWRGYGRDAFPEAGWAVEDGCLRVVAGGGGGDIVTIDRFAEFDFCFEWKVAEGANSGVMFHVAETEEAPWQTGPEYQIFDDAGAGVEPNDPHSCGALYALYAPENKTLKPAGEWNSGRIVVRAGRLSHFVNGVKVLEAELGGDDWNERVANSKFSEYAGFGRQGSGHLCLQDHGNDIWFRNLKVRDLTRPVPGEVELFNGESLEGWQCFSEDGSTGTDAWRVEDGLLKTAGTPAGYLYTAATYESYVLKLEWRFNPETLEAGNGGVLLRVGGEHQVWPESVEAQLMSGAAGDFWTIGEYPMSTAPERMSGRNTQKTHGAERPIGEWNQYEIIVDGPRITLIVNDEVVNEAWDVLVRPGHVALQAEGAEMHFQNIRLAPIEG